LFIVSDRCGSLSLILMTEYKLGVYEKRFPKKTSVPKREEVTGE
jgi:hypothetical protein